MGRVRKRWVNSLGLDCTELEGLRERGEVSVVCLPPKREPSPAGAPGGEHSQ